MASRCHAVPRRLWVEFLMQAVTDDSARSVIAALIWAHVGLSLFVHADEG